MFKISTTFGLLYFQVKLDVQISSSDNAFLFNNSCDFNYIYYNPSVARALLYCITFTVNSISFSVI